MQKYELADTHSIDTPTGEVGRTLMIDNNQILATISARACLL